MATVSKSIADQIKTGNGYYMDDTRVVLIVEYDNAFNGIGYGLVYQGRPNTYTPSVYVRNPRVFWEAKDE